MMRIDNRTVLTTLKKKILEVDFKTSKTFIISLVISDRLKIILVINILITLVKPYGLDFNFIPTRQKHPQLMQPQCL